MAASERCGPISRSRDCVVLSLASDAAKACLPGLPRSPFVPIIDFPSHEVGLAITLFLTLRSWKLVRNCLQLRGGWRRPERILQWSCWCRFLSPKLQVSCCVKREHRLFFVECKTVYACTLFKAWQQKIFLNDNWIWILSLIIKRKWQRQF